MHAPTVSRQLRDLGWRTVASADRWREGVKVRRSLDEVLVPCDFDSGRTSCRIAAEVASDLRELGYEVRLDEAHVWVRDGQVA